jgi:hypothetical protein
MTTTTGDQRTAAGPAGPTPGERARTVLRAAPTLVLRLLGGGLGPGSPEVLVTAHRLDHRGSPLAVLADDDPVVEAVRDAGGELAAVVEAWALVPVPVPDRVRGRVRLDGWVEEVGEDERARLAPALGGCPQGRTVLRLDVTEVTLADGRGDARIAVADYAAALPDPLVDDEAVLLEHVAAGHPREVALLAVLAADAVGGPVVDPVVVGVDRFGLRLRVVPAGRAGAGPGARLGRPGACPGTCVDVHLPFAAPLRHPGELAVAVAVLLERARRRC